ncbi:MAG: DUF3108 domain-containing protein [Simplicispira sp.]|nr:DUF3108 domain-containing protein [Simplicispira sp.]
MPRRPLLVLTAAVLALHWLVLAGLPQQWHHPMAPAPQVFSTRTLAAPQPPAPASATATPAPVRPPAAAARRAPVRPQAPAGDAPAAAGEDTAPSAAEAWAQGPESTPALDDTPAPPAEASAPVVPSLDEPPPALAPEPPTPPLAPDSAPAPSTPPPADAPGAIDIVPPGAVASASSRAAPPVRLPAPRRLQFDVSGEAKKFHYNARAELRWQHDGQRYQARQEVSVLFLGSRTQTSVGDVAASGLLPQRFGDRARSEQAAHFNYAQGRVTFSANTPEAPLAAGTQDRLSVFIQLGALLAAAPERFAPGTRIDMATVSARALDVWSFTVEGEETLDLPAGPLPALKLQRLPRRDYDQKAELWLAPALGYLPARIRITQANGDFVDLRLHSHGPP